jgi:hypothetical protein
VLTGIAVLIKQSAFDAGLAAVVYLLWRERRRGLAPAAVLVAGTLVPVAIAAASAARLSAWLYAVVGYRFEGDSLLNGSLSGRAHQFWLSLPPAGKALGLLALLAAVGWRRSPLLARIWLGAAVLGAIAGGNFHPHYYIQLVPPLSLLAAVGVRTLWLSAPRPAIAAAGVAVAATLALALPVAWATPTNRRRRSGRPIRTSSTTPPSRATCAHTRFRLSASSRSGPTPTSTTSPTAGPPSATSGRATLPRFRAPSRPSATHLRRGGRSSWSSSSRPRSSIRAAAPPLCSARVPPRRAPGRCLGLPNREPQNGERDQQSEHRGVANDHT